MSTTSPINVTTNSKPRGSSAPRPTHKQVLKYRAMQELNRVRRQIAKAAESDKLNAWERGFLADVGEKFRQYGVATRMSLKQAMAINNCLTKAAT